MTILDFVKKFPGYTFHLVFSHLNEDGTTEYDGEYSYRGPAEAFEQRMDQYDWLFGIELTDPAVAHVQVHKPARVIGIDIEQP